MTWPLPLTRLLKIFPNFRFRCQTNRRTWIYVFKLSSLILRWNNFSKFFTFSPSTGRQKTKIKIKIKLIAKRKLKKTFWMLYSANPRFLDKLLSSSQSTTLFFSFSNPLACSPLLLDIRFCCSIAFCCNGPTTMWAWEFVRIVNDSWVER